MAQFLVKVADDRGHLAQQVEHGYSEAEVRERFVQQGYLVYWVKTLSLFSGGKLQLSGRKVKQSQFVIFNQQFLTLIKAGLPILNSLDLLIKRQKDSNLQSLLQNVRERVYQRHGQLLLEGQGQSLKRDIPAKHLLHVAALFARHQRGGVNSRKHSLGGEKDRQQFTALHPLANVLQQGLQVRVFLPAA